MAIAYAAPAMSRYLDRTPSYWKEEILQLGEQPYLEQLSKLLAVAGDALVTEADDIYAVKTERAADMRAQFHGAVISIATHGSLVEQELEGINLLSAFSVDAG